MKIKCGGCGFENELGRVFCINCGVRLDLSRTTIEDMRDGAEADRTARLLQLWKPLLGLVVVMCVILVLWPGSPAGAPPKLGAAAGVRARIWGLEDALNVGQSAGGAFTEEDINAYLASRAGDLGFASLSVCLTPGRFVLRGVRTLGPLHVGQKSLGPVRVSYDVVGYPAGSNLNIRRGGIGHMPLFGPLKRFALKPMAQGLAKARKEQSFLKKAADIKVLEHKVAITLQR